MKDRHRHESPVAESRFFWASVVIILVFTTFCIRAWHIQIYKGEHYSRLSENNHIRRIEIPAPRGLIFDRFGKVLLGNRPFFDLAYIPQYVKDEDKTLKILSTLLHIPYTNLKRTVLSSYVQPKFLPVTLKRNLSVHEVALIEDNKPFLPGVEIEVVPRRDYKENADTPAHMVGYMGEINAAELAKQKSEKNENPYQSGDLIGKQGLEARYEKLLRGKRGYKLIQVDAFGRQTDLFEKEGWKIPIKPAVAGADLVLTIDKELQAETKNAFRGKFGAVVVMNPRNGEILSLLSSPDYDPAIYQDGVSYSKWQSLISDPFKPLFDKSTGGTFPPGSVYKSLVALAALQEGVITPSTTFYCSGSFELGRDIFHCHQRRGHGSVNLEDALVKSCDVFFYNLGMELGIDRIARYAKSFGLGQKLGLNLNKEEPGLIPTSEWKRKTQKSSFARGDAPPIAIGQGANVLTPIQITSLYATIANGGMIWRPLLVKKAINNIGETIVEYEPKLIRKVEIVSQKNFQLLRDMLFHVVADPDGTGRRAQVPGVTVAGKTGSVQVVSLKRNRNREAVVSMKWQEHAIFAAFSPVEQAEVVVAVVSENDTEAGGGVATAPIAQKIIAAYWRLKKEREQNLTLSSASPTPKQPNSPSESEKNPAELTNPTEKKGAN